MIARALNSNENTKLYIYEQESFLESLCPNAQTAHNGSESDSLVSEIANEFDSRDDESEGKVVLCIDDFEGFYRGISQESADILDTITQGGADRGVYVYAACDIESMERMTMYCIKLFTNLLANGNAVAVGGNLDNYSDFKALHREENITFGSREGCMIHNNKVITMKIAGL